MNVVTETVTPKIAEAWLNANKSNRKLRDGIVEKYSADMKAGRWTSCTAPICFYADGDVADGQHRLWAVVESGTEQEFIVVRGLTRADGLNIDTGMGRTIVDNARISGVSLHLSAELIGTARSIEDGCAANSKRGTRSNAEKIAITDRWRKPAEWVCANGPRGRLIRNGITMAAIARAYMHEQDHERLRRFCDVLTSGLYNDESEIAAVVFRNYLLTKGNVSSSPGLWRDTFIKAQNAIHYFMRGKRLSVIKAVQDEWYPLPVQKVQRKKAA